jgi:Cu/Ag efflux protein CusF
MKLLPRLLPALLVLPAAALFAGEKTADKSRNCGCECCQGKEVCCCRTEAAADPAPAPQSHPLKGVVMGIMAEKTALLVKHEEIPGVMRAMTMMFKVDPAVLQQVKRGDAIKALMSRRDDGWWLTAVEVVSPSR